LPGLVYRLLCVLICTFKCHRSISVDVQKTAALWVKKAGGQEVVTFRRTELQISHRGDYGCLISPKWMFTVLILPLPAGHDVTGKKTSIINRPTHVLPGPCLLSACGLTPGVFTHFSCVMGGYICSGRVCRPEGRITCHHKAWRVDVCACFIYRNFTCSFF